jgi:hypothetical protein
MITEPFLTLKIWMRSVRFLKFYPINASKSSFIFCKASNTASKLTSSLIIIWILSFLKHFLSKVNSNPVLQLVHKYALYWQVLHASMHFRHLPLNLVYVGMRKYPSIHSLHKLYCEQTLQESAHGLHTLFLG